MNQVPQAPAPPTTPPTHPASRLDAIFADARKNPGRYARLAAVIVIPVLIAVAAFQFWNTHRSETLGEVAVKWSDAWSAETTPKARAAQLEELAAQLKTPEEQAMRKYDLAVTYKELAEQATTHDEKLSYYEKMGQVANDLKSNAPNSLWAVMPTRPPSTASVPTLACVEELAAYAAKQVTWLKAHPFQGTPEADTGLRVTFELEDGRTFVVGKFNSRAAPYHVQNFVELARRGYFDGTGMSKLMQGYKKGVQAKQGTTPTVIAIEGGHPMTKVTPADRDDDDNQAEIGYSVREEPNPIAIVRGSIVAVQDPASGGDSPSRFKIYAEEPTYAYETAFAEVTEGLDVIDALVNAPANETRPTRPRDLVRVKRTVVEGSVLAPPERPFPPEPKLPEAPASRPESAPSRPESQPK